MTPAARLFAVACRRPAAPDADLLAAWATARDADAFAELVARYGPLVWRTCRAAAGPTPTAEDAFQATFLALSRQAGRVTAVAGFLHRTAGRAVRKAARRDRRPPPPLPPQVTADPLDRLTARELLAAVDAEIARLPERQRLPVLLCGVDGLSADEAARRLGWTAGAVRGRLQRGRAVLRFRLAAKGLTVPAAVGLATVPDRLATAAVAAACGGPVAAGVARLVPGGLSMWGMVKLAGLVGVVCGLAVAGGRPAADPLPPAVAPPDATVRLWERETDGVGSGVWHPDGKHVLAVGAFAAGVGKPHEVRAWEATTGKLAKTFPVPETHLAPLDRGDLMAVSKEGRTVAVGLRGKKAGDHAVAVWAWDRPADPPKLLPAADAVVGVCFIDGPKAERVVVLTESGELSVFPGGDDPKPAKSARLPKDRAGNRPRGVGLICHSTERLVATVDREQISFWNPDRLVPIGSAHPAAPSWHHPLALRPDGRRLTLFGESGVGADRRLILGGYALNTDSDDWGDRRVQAVPVQPMTGPLPSAGGQEWGLNHLSYHPGGRFLALAGKDGTTRVADATSARVAAEWAEGGPVRAAHFAPDGRRLLTVTARAVRVRDVAGRLVPLPPDRDLRLTHEKELDRFAGRWVVSAARIDGKDAPGLIGRDMSGQLVAVDPAVTPNAVNVRYEAGPRTGTLGYAIYEFLDADTYRICYSLDPDRRPSGFTADAGSRQSLFTLKRVK
ncbi:MAG: sigma-70 family RNA polymerase sigma factor [Gemmataceae bacterium]